MNVDDAIRRFRSGVRGPQTDLVATIVAAAPTAGGVHLRHRVRMRTVAVAATVVIAVVVAAAMGILLRDGGRPNPVPAAPTIPPARVDWGMVATLKLTPDPGVSIEEMRRRLSDALAYRTHDVDGAGVEIITGTGNEVLVRLPGAQSEGQVKRFLEQGRLVLLPEGHKPLVMAPNIRDLEVPAPDQERSEGVVYYVQEHLGGVGWSVPERLGSRAAATARLQEYTGDDSAMAAVPRHLAIVGGGDGSPVSLVPMNQAMVGSSVAAFRMEGETAVFSLDSTSGIEDGTLVSVFVDPSGRGIVTQEASFVGSGTVVAPGELRIDHPNMDVLRSAARPDLGGRISTTATSTYGQRSNGPAEPWSPPQEAARFLPEHAMNGEWRKLAQGTIDDEVWSLVALPRAGILTALGMVTETASGFRTDGFSILTAAEPGKQVPGVCAVGVGAPRVTRCNEGTIFGEVHHGVMTVTRGAVGRLDPSIRRIRASVGGITQDAVIDNGWWMLRITTTVPVGDDHPNTMTARVQYDPVEIVAVDSNGNEVPLQRTSP